MNKFRLCGLILLALLPSCLKQKQIKLGDHNYKPISRTDGILNSTISAEQIDSTGLQNAFAYFFSENSLPLSRSLLVMRNGKLVAEGYSHDKGDIDRIEDIQSITKSVISLLVGVEVKKGLITDINAKLFDFFPQYFDDNIAKQEISLRNCLTMESGLAFNGGSDSKDLVFSNGSSLEFILHQSIISDTGTSFLYSDYSPHLISGLITNTAKVSTADFANQNIFQPLDIKDYYWEKTKDGLNLGGFSLYLTPRSLLKIGLLAQNDGIWQNSSIIDSNYLHQATTTQVSVGANYGYLFWILPQYEGYQMKGNGGQFVYVCPKKKLVVVYTAFPNSKPDLWGDSDHLIELIYNAAT